MIAGGYHVCMSSSLGAQGIDSHAGAAAGSLRFHLCLPPLSDQNNQASADSARRIAELEDRLIAMEEALGGAGCRDQQSTETTPVWPHTCLP